MWCCREPKCESVAALAGRQCTDTEIVKAMNRVTECLFYRLTLGASNQPSPAREMQRMLCKDVPEGASRGDVTMRAMRLCVASNITSCRRGQIMAANVRRRQMLHPMVSAESSWGWSLHSPPPRPVQLRADDARMLLHRLIVDPLEAIVLADVADPTHARLMQTPQTDYFATHANVMQMQPLQPKYARERYMGTHCMQPVGLTRDVANALVDEIMQRFTARDTGLFDVLMSQHPTMEMPCLAQDGAVNAEPMRDLITIAQILAESYDGVVRPRYKHVLSYVIHPQRLHPDVRYSLHNWRLEDAPGAHRHVDLADYNADDTEQKQRFARHARDRVAACIAQPRHATTASYPRTRRDPQLRQQYVEAIGLARGTERVRSSGVRSRLPAPSLRVCTQLHHRIVGRSTQPDGRRDAF